VTTQEGEKYSSFLEFYVATQEGGKYFSFLECHVTTQEGEKILFIPRVSCDHSRRWKNTLHS